MMGNAPLGDSDEEVWWWAGNQKESTQAKEKKNSSGRLISVLKKSNTHNDGRAATVEGDLKRTAHRGIEGEEVVMERLPRENPAQRGRIEAGGRCARVGAWR